MSPRPGLLALRGVLACLLAGLAFAAPRAAADQCEKDTCIDRAEFYRGFRKFNRRHELAQDPKRLHPRSFAALQDILDHWDTSEELTDTRWLAYIISTVFWETGGHLYPVREGLCDDAKCAIAHLERLWRRRLVRQRYWEPDPTTGQSYYGRGQVQLTHLVNYWRVGGELTRTQGATDFADFDDKLVSEPDLALTDWVSTTALVEGMVRGWYNVELGRGLGSYISEDAPSDRVAYLEARRTVNGLDKRDVLADFALEIHEFIDVVPAAELPSFDANTVTDEVEGVEPVEVEGSDGVVRGRRADAVDTGTRVGPVREGASRSESRRAPIDFEHPVGPIRNVTGVVAGGAAAAAQGQLRTPPSKKELRKQRREERKRERRQRRRERKQNRGG